MNFGDEAVNDHVGLVDGLDFRALVGRFGPIDCQKRSGSVFIVSALFADDQVLAIAGETKSYNGLEVDGVGVMGLPEGITYRFCTRVAPIPGAEP